MIDGRPNVTWRDPVVPVAFGHLASILGWQVWLIRHDHRPFTHAFRHPASLTGGAVFLLHLFRLLGRFDPFCHLNRFIVRRTP